MSNPQAERAMLKRLIQDDAWNVLMEQLQKRLDELNAEPITGQNAFEELRSLHMKQGRIDGIKQFFDDIERLALK